MSLSFRKIFITGGTGLLGYYLIKTAPVDYDTSCTFFPAYKKDSIQYDCSKYHLDVKDRDTTLSTIKEATPDCVIHTASIARVDYVEKNKEETKRNNLGGTKNIIEACQEAGAKLIYISSNAVFDGRNPHYSEEDPVNPLNYYGKLKVEEEKLVKNSELKYAIIRPILMYGWNLKIERENPVTWLIGLLKAGREVKVVDDISCNPLFAKDCADAVWKVITLNKEGTFHVGGEDELSRYEFACITAEVFGLDQKLISPVKNSFFTTISSRPKNTTYCIDKIKRDLEISPMGAREGLLAMKEEAHETS